MTHIERTIQLLERSIANNNEMIAMANKITDPRMKQVACDKIKQSIERTEEILGRSRSMDKNKQL